MAPGRGAAKTGPSEIRRGASHLTRTLWFLPNCMTHPALVVAAAVSTGMSTAAPVSGQGVLAAGFMASVAYVSSSISRFVSLEVVEALRATLGQGSRITVTGIKAVVDVSVEAAMAVEPRAGTDKQSAYKPIRAVVAVGSTVVGSVVEIAVGTYGSGSDVYANFDLGLRHG